MKKKVFSLFLTLVMSFVFAIPAFAAELPQEFTSESQNGDIVPFAVSIDNDISLTTGNSTSITFDMAKWFADDHNAFKTIVSEVSGSTYKVIIEGSNGYSYTSSEYSNGVTLTTTNAQPKVDYTVYIINTGSGTLKANVKISSYYN